MTNSLRYLLFWATLLPLPTLAQVVEVKTASITSKARRIDKDTKIYDQETGRRISIEEFSQTNQATPNDFRFVPQIDERGEVAYYIRRKTTKEEKDHGITLSQNDYKMPVVGQPLPAFVMVGANGESYTSEDLKGKYVLLSFWLKFGNPFFRGSQETEGLVELAEIARKKGVELISLGITSDSRQECLEAMSQYKLGLMPVPESYEFMKRYGVFSPKTYLLVGPDGILRAILEQESPLLLQEHFVK